MGTFDIVDDEAFLRDRDTELLARRYQPVGPGPFPFVLHVHGGVWTNGSRTSDTVICGTLADAGVGVLSIDFRQAPRHRYPASIADVHYGLRWLRAHAKDFGSRPDWVGGLGVSSGGHQLLLATLRPDEEAYASLSSADVGDADTKVDYLVLCWPVTDPLARYRWARRHGRDQLVALHDAYWADESAMAHGDPHRVLESGWARQPLPRVLLVYGTADDNVPAFITEEFIAAYRRAGGTIDVVRFDGMPHGFVRADPQTHEARLALTTMVSFVQQQAKF
jgi:acetyl esterase/lipase